MKVRFKKLSPEAVMPTKAYDDDFCYDCYAVSEEEVAPNVWKYGLGFALQIDGIKPKDINRCLTFRPRSSIWKTGMVLSNSIGTIDEGYTGEISAVFYHVLPDLPRYKVGDKNLPIPLGRHEKPPVYRGRRAGSNRQGRRRLRLYGKIIATLGTIRPSSLLCLKNQRT